MALLEVENLCVDFETDNGLVRVVDDVSFILEAGERLGIVGESGSGKSVSSLAIMGLIQSPGKVSAKTLCFDGQNLLTMSARQRRKILGKDMAMIFQDPMASLNPCFTVGEQIEETLQIHQPSNKAARRAKAKALLESVGIPDAEARLKAYPHQLSGGMCQRVMIAIAIACKPKLLIADEPTTALDVTIQAQILDLMNDLNRQQGMSTILITHDLAVVSETVDKAMVMYCGQMIEEGPVSRVLSKPMHPYTEALMSASPDAACELKQKRLKALPGTVPSPFHLPEGCRLSPRCAYATEACHSPVPVTSLDDNRVRCIHPLNLSLET